MKNYIHYVNANRLEISFIRKIIFYNNYMINSLLSCAPKQEPKAAFIFLLSAACFLYASDACCHNMYTHTLNTVNFVLYN